MAVRLVCMTYDELASSPLLEPLWSMADESYIVHHNDGNISGGKRMQRFLTADHFLENVSPQGKCIVCYGKDEVGQEIPLASATVRPFAVKEVPIISKKTIDPEPQVYGANDWEITGVVVRQGGASAKLYRGKGLGTMCVKRAEEELVKMGKAQGAVYVNGWIFVLDITEKFWRNKGYKVIEEGVYPAGTWGAARQFTMYLQKRTFPVDPELEFVVMPQTDLPSSKYFDDMYTTINNSYAAYHKRTGWSAPDQYVGRFDSKQDYIAAMKPEGLTCICIVKETGEIAATASIKPWKGELSPIPWDDHKRLKDVGQLTRGDWELSQLVVRVGSQYEKKGLVIKCCSVLQDRVRKLLIAEGVTGLRLWIHSTDLNFDYYARRGYEPVEELTFAKGKYGASREFKSRTMICCV